MDLIDVIYDVAHSHPGGIEALTVRMKMKSADTLRKKVLPTNDTHELTVKELRKIVDLCDVDGQVAKAFANDRGLICIPKPNFDEISDQAIHDLRLYADEKRGEYAKEVRLAMADGHVDFNECVKVQKKFNEMITAEMEYQSKFLQFMAVCEDKTNIRAIK